VKTLENTTLGKGDETSLPIIPGTYPAHVSKVDIKEWNDSIVYNMTFTVAPEVEKVSINKMTIENGELVKVVDADNNPIKINASYLTAKEFRSNGIWLTPKPGDEKWKNRKYKQWFEAIGVVFDVDDNSDTVLGQVEESDIIGMACLIKIGREEYNDKDGQPRSAWKVFQCYPWQNGKKKDADEFNDDVPF
jgi:hypothetical protein